MAHCSGCKNDLAVLRKDKKEKRQRRKNAELREGGRKLFHTSYLWAVVGLGEVNRNLTFIQAQLNYKPLSSWILTKVVFDRKYLKI